MQVRDIFKVGDRVKRNPAHFPPNHPALNRIGTITLIGAHNKVQWDDSKDEHQYYYLDEELVHARDSSL